MEAIAAGFGAAMREDDYTFATYWGHALRPAVVGAVAYALLDAVRRRHVPIVDIETVGRHPTASLVISMSDARLRDVLIEIEMD